MKLKKIFNLFYKDIVLDEGYSRYRSLFNIIATKYTLCDNKIEKSYMLFNKVILKRIDQNGIRTLENNFGFNKKYCLFDIFKKKYQKYYKNHDDIYIFQINSGEIFLFLKYVLHNLIKKHNSRSPLILTNRKYHLDLVKLFYPDIPCIFIKNLKPPIQKKEFEIEGYNFTLVLPQWHLENVEKNTIKNDLGFSNYFHPILELYGLDKNNIKAIEIKPKADFEQSMLKKIKKTGLNINNFIFIAPEAQSCRELDKVFWIELIKKLQLKGFDIFVNKIKKDKKIQGITYKSTFLTLGEALALSRYAKKIIMLRSGMSELLSEAKVPMDILYTDFKKRPFFQYIQSSQVMGAFGFHNLSNINYSLINEINAEDNYEEIYKKLGM